MQITGTLYSNLSTGFGQACINVVGNSLHIAGPLLMGLSESPTLCDLRLG